MNHRVLYRIGVLLGLLFFSACTEKDDDMETENTLRITSIVPTSGSEDTVVRIKGMGFGEDASSVRVLFGELNAPIDNVRDTLITTRVPQGASSGAIKVHVGDNRETESMQSFSIGPPSTGTNEEGEEEGDGGDEDGDDEEDPIPGETPRERVINDYLNNYLPAGENRDPWTGNSDDCEAGELSDALKQAALKRVLYFRRQVGYTHDLPLNAERSRKCQEAALIARANGRRPLTHSPPMSYRCWTQDGYDGSNASNLVLSRIAQGPGYATRAVFLFIEDAGSNNQAVQHRDNVLSVVRSAEGRSFVGIGATDVSMALSIEQGPCAGCPPVSTDVIFPERTPDFVSWPPDTYVMDELVYPRWSFHFLKSFPFTRTPSFGYTFENVSVEMTRKDTGERIDFRGGFQRPYSVETAIVWQPDLPLKRTHPLGHIIDIEGDDVTYVIKIMNIGSSNGPLNYTYEVTIIDAAGITP